MPKVARTDNASCCDAGKMVVEAKPTKLCSCSLFQKQFSIDDVPNYPLGSLMDYCTVKRVSGKFCFDGKACVVDLIGPASTIVWKGNAQGGSVWRHCVVPNA